MRPVVVTGISGFVGRHVAAALLERGRAVRGLTRSRKTIEGSFPQGVELIEGDIASRDATAAVTRDAEAVIHCAGLIKAGSRHEFFATNGLGTERLIEAAGEAGVQRFVHVSSLAARNPEVSHYAASKREGESVLERQGQHLSWIIVRPPAVYGPGDRSTLPLIRALSRRTAWLPGTAAARFSLIHVADLADALAILATTLTPAAARYEIDDGRYGGYGWPDVAAAATLVNGYPTRVALIPRSALVLPALVSWLAARLAGGAPLVSPGKLAELYHPDWVARGSRLEKDSAWRPQRSLDAGLRETMAWYRRQGWLPPPAASSDALQRFPAKWHHFADMKTRRIKYLEHVLIGKVCTLFRNML